MLRNCWRDERAVGNGVCEQVADNRRGQFMTVFVNMLLESGETESENIWEQVSG